ncbi:hypothetical protein DENIS_1121 [Desulfonema ishimotonii]|uniref:TRASH domain-containing protein n=1 Tax=Desulfonema ishimotonii TaxID=45657 RepID=A0A401FT90_9BACT|nr:YHS domain-containing protein [Desulfonema ishimotonii]GBC60176.1 hypothetical protein DENIS_1121 [Desulfonema ishimotonii]
MFRLLVIAGLAWWGYRKLKALASRDGGHGSAGRESEPADDVMIQDPWCKTYFPRAEAVHLGIDGKDYYFCSTECRDKFIAGHLKK